MDHEPGGHKQKPIDLDAGSLPGELTWGTKPDYDNIIAPRWGSYPIVVSTDAGSRVPYLLSYVVSGSISGNLFGGTPLTVRAIGPASLGIGGSNSYGFNLSWSLPSSPIPADYLGMLLNTNYADAGLLSVTTLPCTPPQPGTGPPNNNTCSLTGNTCPSSSPSPTPSATSAPAPTNSGNDPRGN